MGVAIETMDDLGRLEKMFATPQVSYKRVVEEGEVIKVSLMSVPEGGFVEILCPEHETATGVVVLNSMNETHLKVISTGVSFSVKDKRNMFIFAPVVSLTFVSVLTLFASRMSLTDGFLFLMSGYMGREGVIFIPGLLYVLAYAVIFSSILGGVSMNIVFAAMSYKKMYRNRLPKNTRVIPVISLLTILTIVSVVLF